jgi:hypothetical protein
VQGIRSNQVSTLSEHYIFQFHAEWLSKGIELEILCKYFDELLSILIDSKSDFVYLLFEVKKNDFEKLHSSLVVVS